MNPDAVAVLAASKDVALAMSVLFNLAACAAIWRLWKSVLTMQAEITGLMVSLSKETSSLLEKVVPCKP